MLGMVSLKKLCASSQGHEILRIFVDTFELQHSESREDSDLRAIKAELS
jgi:hypothetical protein